MNNKYRYYCICYILSKIAREKIFKDYHQDIDDVIPELGRGIIMVLEDYYTNMPEQDLSDFMLEIFSYDIFKDVDLSLYLNMDIEELKQIYKDSFYMTEEQAMLKQQRDAQRKQELLDEGKDDPKTIVEQLQETDKYKNIFVPLYFHLGPINRAKKNEIMDKFSQICYNAITLEQAEQMLDALIIEAQNAYNEPPTIKPLKNKKKKRTIRKL